jgi:aldehyde:ferredoxin oxidoreductase
MNILYIDLSEKNAEVIERSDLFDKYIGGSGVGVNLLLENCPKGADPLSPENPIILATGPLTGAFPTCTKAVAVFKSPLTNEFGESYAGGRLGAAMRFSGNMAIVIKGKSDSPVYLSIQNDKVYFRDARSIWGISSSYTVGKILRRLEPAPGRRSIIRIGPAGERLVRYANVNVDTYRHFGRLGLGAVFGSKNLKAIAISGSKDLPIENRKEYREIYRELYNVIVNTDSLKKYHDYGTAINVNPLNQISGLPTRNLKSSSFEYAEYISGEHFAENYMSRHIACTGCPVGCIHIATMQIPFAKGFEFETKMIPYDYELIFALGSLLGIPLAEHVLSLIEVVDHLGLDAMSTGTALSWATEAYENHLISKHDTLGLEFSFGDSQSYVRAIQNIVKQPNDFYKLLAKGEMAAAKIYGGEEFALSLGGLGMAGYHTGRANIVGQTGAPRHGHLDNAGYSLDQKASREKIPPTEMVERLLEEDYWRSFVNSLVICLFARGVYTGERIEKALNSIGVPRSAEEFRHIGREIFRLKYKFKVREGFNLEETLIPKRFFETPSSQGKLNEAEIKKMLQLYAKKIRELLG